MKIFFFILAKIHCVADSDCINTPNDVACLPFSIIPQHSEFTIRDAIDGRDQEFIDDMQKLNVQSPTLYARVSDHIPLIINFIEKLIQDGYAYACPSGNTIIFEFIKK